MRVSLAASIGDAREPRSRSAAWLSRRLRVLSAGLPLGLALRMGDRMHGLAHHVRRSAQTLAALCAGRTGRALIGLKRPMRSGRTARGDTLGAGWAGVGRVDITLNIMPTALQITPTRHPGPGGRYCARVGEAACPWGRGDLRLAVVGGGEQVAVGARSIEVLALQRGRPGMVLVETAFGGRRVMDQLVGDPLPRIC